MSLLEGEGSGWELTEEWEGGGLLSPHVDALTGLWPRFYPVPYEVLSLLSHLPLQRGQGWEGMRWLRGVVPFLACFPLFQ